MSTNDWSTSGRNAMKKDLVKVKCSEKKELFDAETLIPMPYNEQPLNIRLTVLGYS